MNDKSQGIDKYTAPVVQKIDWNIAQKEGKELAHIRATEIPKDLQTKLAAIGSKANGEGRFQNGSLTWQDYFNFVEAVWSLIPDSNKLKTRMFRSPDVFAVQMSHSEETTPQTPIVADFGKLSVWKFKLHATDQMFDIHEMEFALTPGSNNDLSKAMTGEVFNKIKSAGLPLRDTSLLWK